MKIALINPPWSFRGSIFFGCQSPHLPLELGYAKAALERDGNDVLLVDAHLGFVWRTGAPALEGVGSDGFDDAAVRAALETFRPEVTVVTTAPTYLHWRSPPPELRVPMQTLRAVRAIAGTTIVVGPHPSTTPGAVLRKLSVDAAIVGECEDVIVGLARTPRDEWPEVSGAAVKGGGIRTCHARRTTDVQALPALRWPAVALERHAHHHQRPGTSFDGLGAEIEASRPSPHHCSFCVKDSARHAFRRRAPEAVLEELDALVQAGVRYAHFIDESFVLDPLLLEELSNRNIMFGVQLRIDDYDRASLALLGRAGCVSIEVAVESVSDRGRSLLAQRCTLTAAELIERLATARSVVPFVQAKLSNAGLDRRAEVADWCDQARQRGISVRAPEPLFPYPGTPEYTLRFGACDDLAWERAHAHFLAGVESFEEPPVPLSELEPLSAAPSR